MATHTLNFPGANLNAAECTVDTATIDTATIGGGTATFTSTTVTSATVNGDLTVDTNTLVVDASTNRVGIGSATPTSTLDVVGAVTLSSTLGVNGVGTFSSTTEATNTTTGALTVVGGISTQTNVHASNVYTHGGLITNRSGTCKKTYSHSGTLPVAATVANATFGIEFSNHIFQARVYATLIEDTVTVSSISFDCCGGHITGGTPGTITIGSTTVVGHSSYPWNVVVTPTTNTVTFKANEAAGAGLAAYYDIFVEYLSSHADGRVIKFTKDAVDDITFNY